MALHLPVRRTHAGLSRFARVNGWSNLPLYDGASLSPAYDIGGLIPNPPAKLFLATVFSRCSPSSVQIKGVAIKWESILPYQAVAPSCEVFVDPPGREWNDFVHATNELVTVMVGTLKLAIGGEEILAKPGDEVFIPKGVRHSVKNISSSTTHWLYGYD